MYKYLNPKQELMAMVLIIVKAQVASLVKELSSKGKLEIDNVTSDYYEALDKKVRKLVDDSVSRAHENGRKTLMPRDL